MKRKTFLKSLLGLAVAPMALAKIKTDEDILKEMPYIAHSKAYSIEEIKKMYPEPLPETFHEVYKQWEETIVYGKPMSQLYRIKGLQDYVNSYHSTILKGIKK